MDVIALIIIIAIVLGLQWFLLCSFAFHKLQYKCEFSVKEAYEGDDLYLVETVYNAKLLPVPWMKVDIHSSKWLDFAETCSVITQDDRRVTSSFILKSYQKVTRRWRLKCLKRGVFTTENVTLISGDLLNFEVVSIPVRVDASLIVYPGTVDIDSLFVPVNLMQSDRTVNRWIVDDPFIVAGSREYTSGDPLNRVHWPSTAKTGNLMIKKNEFTSQRSMTVLLNMQSQLYEYADTINKKIAELGIKVAATLLDTCLKDGVPVRFGTNGCIQADSREAIFTGEASDMDHVKELMKILAQLIMKNVEDFEVFLDEELEKLQNTEVVIITAYLSRRICMQADQLAEYGNTVSILLLAEEFEDDVRPETAELYVLSDKLNNLNSGEVIGI
jgi:uncharacterized protein (DUF58 family)